MLMGDLSRRRGRIAGRKPRPRTSSKRSATSPKLLSYANDLISKPGSASYSMEFSHTLLPANSLKRFIAAHKRTHCEQIGEEEA